MIAFQAIKLIAILQGRSKSSKNKLIAADYTVAFQAIKKLNIINYNKLY
jgi:hypothetical protein